jgi:hypothetical protein
MKCNGGALLVAALLMTDWTVSIHRAFTSPAPSIALPPKAEQAQTYMPPRRGIPSRREGASTR